MKAPSNSKIERLLSDPAVRVQFEQQRRDLIPAANGERRIELKVGNGKVVVLRSMRVTSP